MHCDDQALQWYAPSKERVPALLVRLQQLGTWTAPIERCARFAVYAFERGLHHWAPLHQFIIVIDCAGASRKSVSIPLVRMLRWWLRCARRRIDDGQMLVFRACPPHQSAL